MLLQFNFSNFGPFKNETTLDLEAETCSEYKEQIHQIGNKKVLPLSVIFGANASGKSFIYQAYCYMKYIVCNSVNFDSNSNKDSNFYFADPIPFKLDSTSKNQPSIFEVIITDIINKKEITYQYGFSAFNHQIYSEWLFQLPKTSNAEPKEILKRDKESITIKSFSIDNSLKTILETSTQKETLVLSLAAKLNVEPFKTIFNFFLSSKTDDFANLSESIYRNHNLPQELIESKTIQKNCTLFLQTFEPSIKGLSIEEIETTSTGEKKYLVYTLHKTTDGNIVRFRMEDESSGTQKMFMLYTDLQHSITEGKLLFIDELNARLHPLLLRNLILLFLDSSKNKKNAQLIFTCHEPWILRSKILRRDEIYFTNKSQQTGESTLYSLAEFTDENGVRIRSDEDYEKNYLLGKYDGIPILEPIDLFKNGDK